MISNLFTGLTNLGTAPVLLLLLFGMAIGMFVGMLPGLGVVLVLTLMLPFVYHMSVLQTVSMMLATQSGVYFSASITAIVLNSPGAPESFPTTLDGFPMAKRGEAGKALAISATSTWMGGWIACIIFIGLIQLAGPLATIFHPPEYMAIIILAIVLIAQTGNIPLSKVFISGLLGLMLSFVGSDPVTGVERFTMGMPTLYSGIGVVPFALGVFAITQMVKMYGSQKAVATFDQAQLGKGFQAQVRAGIAETFRKWHHVARSAIIATVLGLIPGIGGFTANFISYGVGQRVSRRRNEFGTGVPEGLMSAEGSSLSKEVGSIIPAVALGLPSGLGMVIFIAALTILGLEPGPTLLKGSPTLPYSMMWIMAIAGLLSCVVGLLMAPQLSRITGIKGPYMFPFIIALAVLGSFADVNTTMGIYLLVVFSILGVVVRDLGYSVAAAAIGLVLGGTFDDNVHLTYSLYGWNFFTRSPLADIFLLIAIYPVFSAGRRCHKNKNTTMRQAAKHPLMEWIFDAVMVVFSITYFIVGMGYPSQAGQIPVVVGILAAMASIYRLARDFPVWLHSRHKDSFDLPSHDADAPEHGTETSSEPTEAEPSAVAVMTRMDHEQEPESWKDRRHQNIREFIGILWFAGTAAAALVLGFKIGVPLMTFIYSMVNKDISSIRKRLVFAVVATAVTGILAYAFVSLFHLTFHGMI